MAPKKKLFFGAILLSFLAISAYMLKSNKVINVSYPLQYLKKDISLLDPTNTDTIWEYYLIENLSCGLIRDAISSTTGYEGCLAETFYQPDDFTWEFRIRNDLKWSDGSSILDNELDVWFQSLRKLNSRHLRYLKLADFLSYNSKIRLLTIRFPFKVDATILHELSLADAALIPKEFKTLGWNKTVGPYYVESWNSKKSILNLKANPHSPLFRKNMPHEAILTQLDLVNYQREISNTREFDVIPLNVNVEPLTAEKLLKNADQVFTSHPMAIIFFYLNKKNRLAADFENRRVFAKIIQRAKPDLAKSLFSKTTLVPEDQMIPKGFDGRLQSFEADLSPTATTLPEIILRCPTLFKKFPGFEEVLVEVFRNAGTRLILEFQDGLSIKDEQFAGLNTFLGNQIDSTGTWSFLTSPPHGILSQWFDGYQDIYGRIFGKNDLKRRKESLDQLHEYVLSHYIAVPFLVGSQRYILSHRLDYSRWNNFDSRLRIYDLSMK